MALIAALGVIGLFVIGVIQVVSAITGYYISSEKGRGGAEGLLFGLLFGPFGLLLAVLMPEPRFPVKASATAGSIVAAIVAVFGLIFIVAIILANQPPASPQSPATSPSRK